MRRVLRHPARRIAPQVRRALQQGVTDRQIARQQVQKENGLRSTQATQYLRRNRPVARPSRIETKLPGTVDIRPSVESNVVLGLFANTHPRLEETVLDDGTVIYVRRRE